jgi:release factor glutamine methyltransferase
MRPSEVARRGADYLDRHGVASPRAESEALLERILGVDRASVFAREQGLSTAEAKAFGRALCRRCTGTPLQHLTGEQGFRGLVLRVRPGVFVPRPETEMLVEIALELTTGPAPVIVDACTGSGAIALAIAQERPRANVYATDVSPEALALAAENAATLSLSVTFLQGDLLAPLPPELNGRVDLVVANPPYLSADVRDDLPADVLADPEQALFGDADLCAKLFGEAAVWLRPTGVIAVEIDESSADAIAAVARSSEFEDVRVRQDLTGRDRFVTGRRP